MIKDYNGKELDFVQKLQCPPLMFHTMTKCGDYIILYGGMKSKDILSGDFYILKMDSSKVFNLPYSENKNSKCYIIYSYRISFTQILPYR